MTREEQHKSGERLKKQVKALADSLDRKGRLKLKVAIMNGDFGEPFGETVARQLVNGEYIKSPGRDLIDVMEGVLAKFRKANVA